MEKDFRPSLLSASVEKISKRDLLPKNRTRPAELLRRSEFRLQIPPEDASSNCSCGEDSAMLLSLPGHKIVNY